MDCTDAESYYKERQSNGAPPSRHCKVPNTEAAVDLDDFRCNPQITA